MKVNSSHTYCFHVSDFVSKCLVNLSVNSEALENVFQSKKLRQDDVFRRGVIVPIVQQQLVEYKASQ